MSHCCAQVSPVGVDHRLPRCPNYGLEASLTFERFNFLRHALTISAKLLRESMHTRSLV